MACSATKTCYAIEIWHMHVVGLATHHTFLRELLMKLIRMRGCMDGSVPLLLPKQ